jgi:NAD(P)H dehydrogenase (quinone)
VEAYAAALMQRGHRVACRDLYAMGFNPVLSARDMAAFSRGKLPRDIRIELKAIRAADVITLISPLWWSGFPAMLKGYVDRVFSAASGYAIRGGRQSLSGKKAAIIMTSEATVEELKSSGIKIVGHVHLGGIDPMMSRTSGERHLETVCRFVRRAF